jgi:hypothetical protein
MATIVSGYEIRQIRGEASFALVLHLLDLKALTSATTIRMVSEDISEILRFLKSREKRFGEEINVRSARPLKLTLRGKERVGKVAGHSVTIDEWFGLRAWTWLDMEGEGGQINVPVLVAEVGLHELKPEEGESLQKMFREYVAGTLAELRTTHPLRSVWQVTLDAHGRYIFDSAPAAQSAVGANGGKELRA